MLERSTYHKTPSSSNGTTVDGYQGSESDSEVKGEGNSYTTQFRQLDPRLGRWLSLDPMMTVFPSITPYSLSGNCPIVFNDPYGLNPSNDDGGGDVIQIQNDGREYTGSYLPKYGQAGQTIEIHGSSEILQNQVIIAKWNENQCQWDVHVEYDLRGTHHSGPTIPIQGMLDETPVSNVSNSESIVLTKTTSTDIIDKADKQNKKTTNSQVADIVSKTTTVGGVTAILVETSAEDIAKPPKYKSKAIPTKSAWAKAVKGVKKVAKVLGNALGVTSLVNNSIEAIDKWRKRDKWGAAKAGAKAVVDGVFLALKANPVVLVLSIGWGVFSNWW
ncbi:hypothetical protein [Lutibacter sp.]